MISFDLLLAKLPYEKQRDALTELAGNYFASGEDLLNAIAEDDNGKLETALHETADGNVSVYTSERYAWASEHIQQVASHEDDSGATDAADRIAYAWYMDELETLQDTINEVRQILDNTPNV